MDLFLPALGNKQWPRFRFYPSKDNCLMSTDQSQLPGGTFNPPVILQAILIVAGPQYSPTVRKQLMDNYERHATVVSGISFDRQIITYNPYSDVEFV